LAAIAAEVGYASEFSFAAAFKRRHGVAPGRWRARRSEHEPLVPEGAAALSSSAGA
jgi:AraC-like DNA-binding protein